MDLSQLDLTKNAEAGAELVIEHPVTGEPLDIKIRLVGTDSSRYRNKVREFAQRRINRKSKSKDIDFDLAEREACELLAACTLGWSGVEEGGKTIEFSVAAAAEVYANYRWIREQVDAFMAERANFFLK